MDQLLEYTLPALVLAVYLGWGACRFIRRRR